MPNAIATRLVAFSSLVFHSGYFRSCKIHQSKKRVFSHSDMFFPITYCKCYWQALAQTIQIVVEGESKVILKEGVDTMFKRAIISNALFNEIL